MVSVLASSVVDRGLEPRWIKPKTMKLLCVASPLSTQHYGVRAKTGWLGIRILYLSGATCCFSELAL